MSISYLPTDGLSYDPGEPVYWSPEALDKELLRTFEQYLKFPVQGVVPVAVGNDLHGLAAETRLTSDQRTALAADLD